MIKNMKKAPSILELNALLVGSNSSLKNLVGNIILGKPVFDTRDATSCRERGEEEVCGRRVVLVKAPGWLRGYDLSITPELFKTEATLSATPGLHAFILVINTEVPFKKLNKKATKQHLQHCFGDKVWDHTIVVFIHRRLLDHKATEDYIKKEGASLQSTLEACGNRYHFLCEDGTDNSENIRELLEKIDSMVAENGCYDVDRTLVDNAESRRKEVDRRAEELRQLSQQRRLRLRKLLTESVFGLRILMVGWVFSGKSATANTILRAEAFPVNERTIRAAKRSGKVSGRDVVIVDTPGWWKFFPGTFMSSTLKSEIFKGLSLCLSSPNVILLVLTLDMSFTNDDKQIIQENMRIFGQEVWRYVIVLFTFGDAMGDKSVEQHIESEGAPLHWLLEKCGNRYHVIDNTLESEDQVTELIEKMEEMVVGNSSFSLHLLPASAGEEEPEPQETRGDRVGVKNTPIITEQLNVEWDRRYWTRGGSGESMDLPLVMSEGQQTSDGADEEEEKKEHEGQNPFKDNFDFEIESDDDTASDPMSEWRRLLEKEWSRREMAMEQASWRYCYNNDLTELNALLVGSNSSLKNLVGNIILGKPVFDTRDVTSCRKRGEEEVCGRRVVLVKAPGWLRGYDLSITPELFKTEATLSVTPGLHAFILVINTEVPFKKGNKKATKQHLQQYFGDKVWDHTIVVFIHRRQLDHKATEDYIKKEGASLQSTLEACGNRYHFLCEDGTDNSENIRELLEKIDSMVAENGCYDADKTLVDNAESRRKEVERRAEELRQLSQQRRLRLRKLLTESVLGLRILMVGWVFSGKSATANTILRAEAFPVNERTTRAAKRSGKVSGRDVVIMDTPGWWKFFPGTFMSSTLKSEIFKGLSLCSLSPNVILLVLPLDTSFTNDDKLIIQENMRIFGQEVWRYVIVLFTFGDAMGDKSVEQHIESEGAPLHWLIEKCSNRYHVIDNTLESEDQVTELIEKMEEMVVGNSSFSLHLLPASAGEEEPEPQETSGDRVRVKNTPIITEQLNVEWDRRYWTSGGSMGPPLNMSEGQQTSDGADEEEEQKEHEGQNPFKDNFDFEIESDDETASDPMSKWRRLLEKEWSRREMAMEQASWRHCYYPDSTVTSEPDNYQLLKSRQMVLKWMNTQNPSSGYGTESSVDDLDLAQHETA
ncbi:uncharacterized protein V6R79_012550 [Siganus canaliculatus]